MSLLKFNHVSFAYAGNDQKVLKDITFSIQKGEMVLIIGGSGSGKTTLIRHMKKNMMPIGRLTGIIEFREQELVSLDDRTNAQCIGYVQQNPDNQIVTDRVWHELAFGLENLGLDAVEIRRRVAEMSEYFGITDWYDKKIDELSGGQKQLLNLASIMVMQPSLLILDEPTAQLDPLAQKHILDILHDMHRDFGITIVMVEHHLEHIYASADRVIALENGQIVCNDSPLNTVFSLMTNDSKMFIGMPAPIQIYEKYHMIMGSKHLDTKYCPLSLQEGRKWANEMLTTATTNVTLHTTNRTQAHQKSRSLPVISIKQLTFRYQKHSDNIIDRLDLNVPVGTITAIVGGNGAGKSTLLKLIMGIYKPLSGKIKCNGRTCLLPQNPMSLFTEISVEEELGEVLLHRVHTDQSLAQKKQLVDDMLTRFGLQAQRKQHPYDLSGGQQQKLALAKILLLEPEILLLDEPTKGLDPYFKQELGEMLLQLQKKGITILLVSHDIEFCSNYTEYCAFLFHHGFVSQNTTREFLAGNMFFTTQTNKMMSQIDKYCITVNDCASLFHQSKDAGGTQ